MMAGSWVGEKLLGAKLLNASLVDECVRMLQTITDITRAVNPTGTLPTALQKLSSIFTGLGGRRRNLNVSRKASRTALPILRRCEETLKKIKDVVVWVEESPSERRSGGPYSDFTGEHSHVVMLLRGILHDLRQLETVDFCKVGDSLDEIERLLMEALARGSDRSPSTTSLDFSFLDPVSRDRFLGLASLSRSEQQTGYASGRDPAVSYQPTITFPGRLRAAVGDLHSSDYMPTYLSAPEEVSRYRSYNLTSPTEAVDILLPEELSREDDSNGLIELVAIPVAASLDGEEVSEEYDRHTVSSRSDELVGALHLLERSQDDSLGFRESPAVPMQSLTVPTYGNVHNPVPYELARGSSTDERHPQVEESHVDIEDQTLDTALSRNDLSVIDDILQREFDTIAVGPWAWLRELKDDGLTSHEIAELLYEQHNDHPWIYFARDAYTGKQPELYRHVEGCVHMGGSRTGRLYSTTSIRSEEEKSHIPGLSVMSLGEKDVRRTSTNKRVASACGLAGIVPPPTRSGKWRGKVYFDNSGSVASVSYRPDDEPATWSHIRDTLRDMCSAFADLQTSGHCCDSFTIIRNSVMRPIDQETSVEVCTINATLLVRFLDELDKAVADTGDRGFLRERTHDVCRLLACKVLTTVWRSVYQGVHDLYDLLLDESCRQICALAVQVLCLGFLSYCQAHTGPLELFFLELKLTECRLFGTQQPSDSAPRIFARLQNLTCLGSMLHSPVLVFGFARNERNSRIANSTRKYNVCATPEQIIDTWGPGNFVVSSGGDGKLNIISILIGGGSICLDSERHNMYHWSPDLQQTLNQEATMRLTEKITVATSIALNLECNLSEEDCLRVCDAYRDPLGTFEPYWAVVERQAGFQGGQYATVVYNQTWAKRTGTTLKELQMLQPIDQILPFLESTWGLQVSFCSGLARRVKMRELMADVLPAFMQRKVPCPALWSELRDTHGFLDTLKQSDLAPWLSRVSQQHSTCYDFACALIRSIAMILHDTGIDPSEKHFVVGWIPAEASIPLQCIRLPVTKTNYWTKVLQDSSDCATFAYLTTACLQLQGRGCRNTKSSWHGEIALVETEVHRHVDRYQTEDLVRHWRLEDGQSYAIGRYQLNQSVQLRAHVERPDPSRTPRLIVTPSGIPLHFMNRVLLKRARKDRLRERLTALDEAQRAIIASKSS